MSSVLTRVHTTRPAVLKPWGRLLVLFSLCTGAGLVPAWADTPSPAPAPALAPAPATVPAEVFFAAPELSQHALSPSGRWLAMGVQPPGLRRGLAVYDLHGQEPPREVARFSDTDIRDIHWVGDEVLAFSLLDTRRGSADQVRGAGLFTVRRNGEALRQHILMNWWSNPSLGTRASRRLDATHRLVHVPLQQQAGAETLIVRGARTPNNPRSDWVLKRLHIATGDVQLLNAAEPSDVSRWWFDAVGQPVLAAATESGQTRYLARGVDDSGALSRDWKLLLQAPTLELPWKLHSRDLAGRVYVTEPSGARGEAVLKRLDRRLGQPEAQAMLAVPGFDFVGALVQEAAAGEDPLLGLRVLTEERSTVWLHPEMAAVQQAVDQLLPARTNQLVCSRCREAERTVIVFSSADRQPGDYWVWRGTPEKPTTWRRIGLAHPAVDPRQMAELAFTRFAARDGLEIPLWVTLPSQPGAPAGPSPTSPPAAGAAPAVVLVHGGPWVRGGHWAWDRLPQFLASRGYVVLEPEFRGSAGYGDRHFRAGWKQWGQAMQDDLADAVRWAAERGLVDPQRVCIAGASYGGYAALMGLVRQSETFRCAAAWAPLADVRWLLREGSPDDWSDEVRSSMLPVMLADRWRDSELVAQISPVEQAARIRSPLLLAWGEEDTRTPPSQVQSLVDALRAAGQTPETVAYPGEGHQWLKTTTHLDFARRLEAFLARSLAPAPAATAAEPAASASPAR